MKWTESQLRTWHQQPRNTKQARRTHRGRHPEGLDWRFVTSLGVFQGIEWLLYRRAVSSDDDGTDWVTFKLIADGLAPYKANYWLVWNGDRWAAFDDPVRLERDRYYLLRPFALYLFNHGWLAFLMRSFQDSPNTEQIATQRAFLRDQWIADRKGAPRPELHADLV